MEYLPHKRISSLVRAACEIALDERALVDGLPPHVASKLDAGSSAANRLWSIFHQLNRWAPPRGQEPPLCRLLRTAVFLAEGRVQGVAFEEALAEVERVADGGPPEQKPPPPRPPRLFHEMWMKRAKRFYSSHGYDVFPPEAEHSPAFLAYRGIAFVEVVAVVDEDVEEAIAAVRQLVDEIQHNEPFAQGYVVLNTNSPEQLRADEAKVRGANLRVLTYNDLPPIGAPEVELFVDRQLAWILAEPDPSGSSDADLIDVPLEDHLRGVLADRTARVLVLNAPSRGAVWHARRRLTQACSEDFESKPHAPAPIVLPIAEQPPADLKELFAGAFHLHGVRFSPMALPQLLESGMVLPIFAVTGHTPPGAGWALVRQAVIGKAKAVLVHCEVDAGPIPSLTRHLNLPAEALQFVTARGRSPGAAA